MGPAVSSRDAVRAVAVVEAAKSALALLVATGLLTLVHRDLHAMAVRLVEHSHFNPAAKYPLIFLRAADDLQNMHLMLVAAGAAVYAAVRAAEAYGLYRERSWAEWLAATGAAVYLPIEVVECARRPGALGIALLVVNLSVVWVMVTALRRRRVR